MKPYFYFRGPMNFHLGGLSDDEKVKVMEAHGAKAMRSTTGALMGFTLAHPRDTITWEGTLLESTVTYVYPKKTGECPCGGNYGVCGYHPG